MEARIHPKYGIGDCFCIYYHIPWDWDMHFAIVAVQGMYVEKGQLWYLFQAGIGRRTEEQLDECKRYEGGPIPAKWFGGGVR